MQHLILIKIDRNDYEAGVQIPGELEAAMGELVGKWAADGTLVTAAGLRPTREGKRVRIGGGGKVTVHDGPFTEAKEVIGGFFLLRTDSDAHAEALTRMLVELHARVMGPQFVLECEVRRIDEPPTDA